MVNLESADRQNQQMTLKPGPTSGRFKVISSIVITMNFEFNSMCRLPDLRMCGLKYGRKLVKPLRIEKKQEWKNERPKLDNARRQRNLLIDPDDQDYKETLKTARRKLERAMAPAVPSKRKAPTSTTKVVAKHEVASQKIPKRFMAAKWSLMTPLGNEWNLLCSQNMKIA